MGMPISIYYTAEMLRALPDDGNKYETVHGELLVTPAPRPLHEIVVTRLALSVATYLKHHPVGFPFTLGEISWSDDTLVSPDLFVVELAQARTLQWSAMTHPLLVVEVLSPSHARQDRFTKRRLYQEAGTPLYWLLDADAKVVEVWSPEASFPVTENEAIAWHPVGAAEALVIQLAELFGPL